MVLFAFIVGRDLKRNKNEANNLFEPMADSVNSGQQGPLFPSLGSSARFPIAYQYLERLSWLAVR
jgi:hypothetical protein